MLRLPQCHTLTTQIENTSLPYVAIIIRYTVNNYYYYNLFIHEQCIKSVKEQKQHYTVYACKAQWQQQGDKASDTVPD